MNKPGFTQQIYPYLFAVARRILPQPVRAALLRRCRDRLTPRVGRVRFGDLRRVTPINRRFGFDRGQPVDRFYIEHFLAHHAADIQQHVLEIGDDTYTRMFGGQQVSRSDVLHVHADNPRATIVADLATADQIPSHTFDCIILTQTLHLIYDFRAALQHLNRILKPSGVLLLTTPGLSQIDQGAWREHWYWSFTARAIRELVAETFPQGNVVVETYGNVLSASAFLYGLAAGELRPGELTYHDPAYEVIVAVRAQKVEAVAS